MEHIVLGLVVVVVPENTALASNDHNKTKYNMLHSSNQSGTVSSLRIDRAMSQMEHAHDDKSIFVYLLCIDPEGDNPSGSVNFSKVLHAKLSFDVSALSGKDQTTDAEFYVDV